MIAWMPEKPKDIFSALNILREAIAERISFFGLEYKDGNVYSSALYKLPPVLGSKPLSRALMDEYIYGYYSLITSLLSFCYDENLFGSFHGYSADNSFYNGVDEDIFAWGNNKYWGRNAPRPHRHITISQWIDEAAKLVNKIKYPDPYKFFVFRTTLRALNTSTGEIITGEYPDVDQISLVDDNENNYWVDPKYPYDRRYDITSLPETLVSRAAYLRTNPINQRWEYGYRRYDEVGSYRIVVPNLTGECEIQTDFKVYDSYEVYEEKTLEQKFSFSSKVLYYDFSNVQEYIDDILRSGYYDRYYSIYCEMANITGRNGVLVPHKIKFEKSNFQELPYKYLDLQS